MTTKFGGMGTCFEADEMTAQWIARRKLSKDRRCGLYFRPDAKAEYAVRQTIDLSSVKHTLGIYPNPDDIVLVTSKEGMKLDVCFIGACTTAEVELILATLVLEAGLRQGLIPVQKGKRRVTPGSLIIIEALEKEGLLEVYSRAGFEIGAPGCSYCVGINDVDVAQEGEVWLSSQNRNFRNRRAVDLPEYVQLEAIQLDQKPITRTRRSTSRYRAKDVARGMSDDKIQYMIDHMI